MTGNYVCAFSVKNIKDSVGKLSLTVKRCNIPEKIRINRVSHYKRDTFTHHWKRVSVLNRKKKTIFLTKNYTHKILKKI